MQGFFDKLNEAASRNDSLLCIGLDPTPDQIPAHLRARYGADIPAALLAWNSEVIAATHDLVCAYKPNIAFYEALGEAGMRVLRETLAQIPKHIPVLLDAKRGDMGNTAAAYARACFEELGADAVTLSPYLGRDSIDPFARYADKGLFVLCHTSNPSADTFQHLQIEGANQPEPLYLAVTREAISWSANVALVVGATYAEAMADVRRVAPDTWFLVPGIGAQGGDLEATVAAGLRADGKGLIISASRSICSAADPRAAATELRDAIRAAVTRVLDGNTARAALPATSQPIPGAPDALDGLINGLHELGAVRFGSFTLASGMQSPIYIDLRLLVSKPALLAEAARAYAGLLVDLNADRICGVPYAALPIGTAVALESGTPLIYPRKEVKQHGTGKEIEGAWNPGERVVIVEDLITSGGSTIQTAERLRALGMIVEDAIVLIDREQGGAQNLAAAGIRTHSVTTLSAILTRLVAAGKLDAARYAEIQTWLAEMAR